MNSNNLPSGWGWTRLGEIIAFEYGKGLIADKREQNGNIPVYGSNGIVGYHSIPLIKKPCLIIGRKGAAGYVHISKVPCWAIDTTYFIIPPDELNLVFLYFLLSTLNLNSLDKSTAIPGLNRNDAYALEIPLPPLPEQRAIVSKIEQLFSDLDNGIENFKKAQAQLKLYRQSVLKAACEGKLVPTEAELARAKGREYEHADVLLARILKERREKWNGKGKYKEAEAIETGELPELPEGWCWVNLEQLKSFSLYRPRYSSDDYANDGYIVLRTSDISESGKVDVSSAPCLNISKDDFSKYKVELGDLLITRTGSLGTLAVFNDNIESIPGAYLIMYRLVMNLGISWYIFYFLKSPLGQKHLIAGGAGVGRPNLNAPTIEVIPIPFPPHSEQRRIIAEVERRLSVSDKMEATIAESLQKAESLRQSILKKAFEGKLLNKKELGIARNAPDWEPAEKLLERIKAEKVKAQKNKHISGE